MAKLIKCINCGSSESIDEIVVENKVSYQCFVCNTTSDRATSLDSRLKLDLTKEDQPYHHLAGLVILNEKKEVLLLKRRIFPFAWSLIMGHMHNNETPSEAARRELLEESGIDQKNLNPIVSAMVDSECRTGIKMHMVYAFKIHIDSTTPIVPNSEAEEIIWADPKDLDGPEYRPMSKNAEMILRSLGYISK